MTPLDPAALRLRFPALSRTGEDGRPVIYADAPGGSQVPRDGDRRDRGPSPERDQQHARRVRGQRGDRRVDRRGPPRRRRHHRAPTPARSCSGRTRRRSSCISRDRSGGRSVPATRSSSRSSTTTRTSGRGCSLPRTRAPRSAGSTSATTTSRSTSDSFDAALTDRTRLVAFTLASNAVGTIPPAAELIRRVHAVGALAAVDGVHFAQHRALDLHGLDADILACSPYKFFGPHLGVLSVRRELLETWTPYKLRPAPDDAPERWETGTQNHEGLAGLIAAVDYLADVGRTYGDPAGGGSARRGRGRLRARSASTNASWPRASCAGVADIPGVRLWGIADEARLDERTPDVRGPRGRSGPAEDGDRTRASAASTSGTGTTTRSP